MATTIRWRVLSTPNPAELSFVVIIPQDVVRMNLSCMPAIGSTFKTLGIAGSQTGRSVGWIPDAALATDSQFGLYIFTDTENEGTDIMFFYGKPKTTEEANTPWRKQWSKFGNHRWHPILKNLILLENPSFPRSTNFIQNGQQGFATAPSYDDRYTYIPDVNEGTRFFTEEFQSPTQFVIPRYRTPVPTGVQYSVGDLRGSFPEALHDDIDIPATRSANAIYLGGAAYSGNGSVEGQFFPRTNFKTWLPYIVYDEQELTSGVWYRKRIRVFPPARPKAIRRA